MKLAVDIWVGGLFIFEYTKDDQILQSDTRLLPDKADADADLFSGETNWTNFY